jgi:hypothetical protein
MKSVAALTITLAFLVLSGISTADVIITMENRDLTSDDPAVSTGRVLVSGDKLMMEMDDGKSGSDGPGQVMIYRGDEDQILVVEHARKSYMVLDREAMAGVSEQMSQAMKQMEEELAKLPEDQRKMMEERMGSMFKAQSAEDRPIVETRKTGEKKTIDGYSCVGYENLVDGEKKSQMWVADLSQVGVPPEAFDVFKDMAQFMQDLMSSLPALSRYGGGGQAFQGLEDIDGFPVLFQHLQGDEVMYESAFKSVEKTKVDPSTFEVPDGYKQMSMGQGG